MPPFKLVALPGQKRRVKNDVFSPFVSFGVYAPRGVAEKIGGSLSRVFVSAFLSQGDCTTTFILVASLHQGQRIRVLAILGLLGHLFLGLWGQTYSGKPTGKLKEKEFREHFYIPNGVSVQLVDGNAMSTEKAANHAIYFSNEQFNVGLRFPLPSLFKEFIHFTQIPPTYIHSNIVRVLMGVQYPKYAVQFRSFLAGGPICLHHQEGEDIPLQPVCSYPVSSIGDQPSGFEQGESQRACAGQGHWASLSEPPKREFTPNYSLKLPGRVALGICPGVGF
ncbi:hypothetical protein CK203_023905 [Vitis vinifera]|uniref:Uncharacterized protein n=1 Tax=Vitis vinifera TaxID=29760 RepID=A0A438JAD0_VITVI|nr:hypothetical protein CK203_023905 [Vitis vinifera]